MLAMSIINAALFSDGGGCLSTLSSPLKSPLTLDDSKDLAFPLRNAFEVRIPDPILGSDGHFLPFKEVYRPPLSKKKCLLLTPLLEHAKKANMLLQCDKCSKWVLVYFLRKLTTVQQ